MARREASLYYNAMSTRKDCRLQPVIYINVYNKVVGNDLACEMYDALSFTSSVRYIIQILLIITIDTFRGKHG